MKFPQPYTAIEDPPPSKSTIYKINNTSDYNPPAISPPPFLFEFSLQYVVLLPTECLVTYTGGVYNFNHLSPNIDRNKIS